VDLGEAGLLRVGPIEVAIFPEMFEAGLLTPPVVVGMVEMIGDLVFEAPVLVEDQRAASIDPHGFPGNFLQHFGGRRDLQQRLDLARFDGQDLDIFRHRLAQHETVRADADTGPRPTAPRRIP